MFYFVCLSLLGLIQSTIYTFNSTTITHSTISTTSVASYLPLLGDTCGPMIPRPLNLYHLSTANILQRSSRSDLSIYNAIIYVALPSVGRIGYGVNNAEGTVFVALNRTVNTGVWYQGVRRLGFIHYLDFDPAPNVLFFNRDQIILLTFDYSNNWTNLIRSGKNGVMINEANLSSQYKKVIMDKNGLMLVLWTDYTQINVLDFQSFTSIANFTPSTIPSANITSVINFDDTNQIILVQTDHYNPIQLINLTSLTIVDSYYLNATIRQIWFADQTNNILHAQCTHALVVIDLTIRQHYQLPPLNVTTLTSDSSTGSIFTCKDNKIEQIIIAVEHYKSTSTQQTVDSSSVGRYSYSDQDEVVLGTLNNILQWVSRLTSLMMKAVSSVPATGYVLSFLNFFSMSSLYVLLETNTPHYVNYYLRFLYKKINEDLLALFGVTIYVSPLGDEKVNSGKGLEFSVSSEVISSNIVIFIVVVINLLIIIGLQQIFKRMIINKVLSCKFENSRKSMICFQVTNLITPILLPWTFVMHSMGVKNIKSKFSVIFYLIIFFMALVFPIYYLFDMLKDRAYIIRTRLLRKCENQKDKKIQENRVEQIKRENKRHSICYRRSKTKNENSSRSENQYIAQKDKPSALKKPKSKFLKRKQLNFNVAIIFPQNQKKKDDKKTIKKKHAKSNIRKSKKKDSSIPKQAIHSKSTLWNLLTADIVEQWYQCQINFLLPSLVLFQNPTCFLIVIFLFWMLGVVIAFKNRGIPLRLNSIVLSIYPLLFHTCFMVFQWCQSDTVLFVTECICLLTFLLGSLHHSITFICEFVVFVIYFINLLTNSWKINAIHDSFKPQEPRKRKNKQEKGAKSEKIEKYQLIHSFIKKLRLKKQKSKVQTLVVRPSQ